jgi:hypothetical protein
MPAIPSPMRLLVLYGLLSLAAVALGGWVCALSGVPAGSWLRNVAVWPIGLLLAGALAALARERAATILLVVGVVILGSSLAGIPQDGVRRWLDAGPLHINVAFVVLPLVVVALSWTLRHWWSWALAFAGQAVLVAQPDASQATAFGAGLAVLAVVAPAPRPWRIGLVLLASGLALVSWFRPDPLEAVAEVEEIIALAIAVSPVLAVLAVTLIAGASAAPALAARGTPAGDVGLALSAYMLAAAATTVLGAFPVPLLGVGMSPILGFWLGVGLLAARLRSAPIPASGS